MVSTYVGQKTSKIKRRNWRQRREGKGKDEKRQFRGDKTL